MTKLRAAPAQNVPGHVVAAPVPWTIDPNAPSDPAKIEARYVALEPAAQSFTFRDDMRCVARELARVLHDQRAAPSERLQAFIETACAASVKELRYGYLSGQDDVTLSDEALITTWHSTLPIPPNPGKLAGFAIVRKGETSVVLLAVANPAPPVQVVRAAEARRFQVKGTVATPAGRVLALINRGAYGDARCDADASVALPAFSFSREMAKGDSTALVDIVAQEPGQLLLHRAAQVLLRRSSTRSIFRTSSSHRICRPSRSK